METLLNVGGTVNKDTATNLAEFVERVFDSAKKNGMSEAVTIEALKLTASIGETKYVTVKDCHFEGASGGPSRTQHTTSDRLQDLQDQVFNSPEETS